MTTAQSIREASFEAFLTEPSIGEHTEWVDGMVLPMHAVDDQHDALTRWLGALLDTYVRRRGLGRLLGEPFVMKLPGEPSARSPDLFFVRAERLDRIRPKHLDGPADLAIEVTSPESRFRDEVHKLAEYERGGVSEYWLLDPHRQEAEFYRLDDTARYSPRKPEPGGVYTSPLLPEMRLEVAWLWQRPLPDTIEVLRDWGIV